MGRGLRHGGRLDRAKISLIICHLNIHMTPFGTVELSSDDGYSGDIRNIYAGSEESLRI
jgi:hypothetical protein